MHTHRLAAPARGLALCCRECHTGGHARAATAAQAQVAIPVQASQESLYAEGGRCGRQGLRAARGRHLRCMRAYVCLSVCVCVREAWGAGGLWSSRFLLSSMIALNARQRLHWGHAVQHERWWFKLIKHPHERPCFILEWKVLLCCLPIDN
eukprot:1161215-Pelagomonas_calceolata.AAC.11